MSCIICYCRESRLCKYWVGSVAAALVKPLKKKNCIDVCRIPGSSWKNFQSNGVDLCRQTVCKLMSRLEERKRWTKKAKERVYKISFASWDVFKTDDSHTCKCLLVCLSELNRGWCRIFMTDFVSRLCVDRWRCVYWKISQFRVQFSLKLAEIWLEFPGFCNNWIVKKGVI